MEEWEQNISFLATYVFFILEELCTSEVLQMTEREKREIKYETYDKESLFMIKMMCKDCKFYEDRCIKNRTLRECAVKFLKNRD